MPADSVSSLDDVKSNTGKKAGVVIIDPEYDALEIESDLATSGELSKTSYVQGSPAATSTKVEGIEVSKPKSRTEKMNALKELKKAKKPKVTVEVEPEVVAEEPVEDTVSTAETEDMLQALKEVISRQQEQIDALTDLALPDTETDQQPVDQTTEEGDSPDPSEDMEAKAVQVIKDGFDGLNIPGLSPIPQRPSFRVEFDLGQAGKHQAWYHWVSEHNGGLFLAYDNRFEFGSKYSPPDMGDETIIVRLPDQGAVYSAYSTDFVHPFGVFEITNLVIAEGSDNGIMDNVAPDDPFIGPGE